MLTLLCPAGLLVSVLIFQQGWTFFVSALRQLTDAGVSPRTRAALHDAIAPLLSSPSSPTSPSIPPSASASADVLLGVSDIRALRRGANMFVDLTAHVPAALSVAEAAALEARVRDALVAARRDVKEVRVRFRPVDEAGPGEEQQQRA